MSYEFIKVERREHVHVITIDRPERRNALHPPACYELEQAFDAFQADQDAWVSVLTGSGDVAFCAGNDLKESALGDERFAEVNAKRKAGFGGICDRHDLFKPIIGAINGVALGGGFEIILACDILIAAEHATFGMSEPLWGRFPRGGALHRLPRMLPHKVAMGLMLTGKPIPAREAWRIGLVNEVVPKEELAATTDRWVNDVLACAPLSNQVALQYRLNEHMRLDEAMRARLPLEDAAFNAQDRTEGTRAFVEKRPPRWKGF